MKRRYFQMQEMRKKNLFKLKPKLAWGQLKGKKEDVKGHFTNEEMLDYVQRLYMHEVWLLWLRTLKHKALYASILMMSIRE